jgi:hypothetical protein
MIFLTVRIRMIEKKLLLCEAMKLDEQKLTEDTHKSLIKSLREMQGDLGVRADKRAVKDDKKTTTQLLQDFIEDCVAIYDESKWAMPWDLCADCDKYKAWVQKKCEDEVDRAAGVDT